jgi:hypothetical protein
MDMARSARLFLCACCRDQVLLCSHCDRGQQYCSRACSGISRRQRRRDAAKRYQCSPRGQLKHAARTACWRRRRRSMRKYAARGDVDKVTHQGCPDAGVEHPLLACDTPDASETPAVIDSLADTVLASAGAVPLTAPAAAPPAALTCRRCARPLLPHVRLGYLRPGSVGLRRAHDHPS